MRPLRISDGSLEALKWIALLLMTGDHVNKYLFNATLPVLFEAGRIALPLFIFVLAYNLARPGVMARGAYDRTMKRLALFGAVASAPFIALGGLASGWWPLNVLFTLLVIAGTLLLIGILSCGVLLPLSGLGAVIVAWRYRNAPPSRVDASAVGSG